MRSADNRYHRSLIYMADMSFLLRSIWTPKVAFFTWTAALSKILMIDNLRRRSLVAIDCCYMCKCRGEIVDNLLFHRPIAIELWSMEFGLFGIYWIMPNCAVQLLASWQGQLGHHQNIAIWKAIPHRLIWCIWREHNA